LLGILRVGKIINFVSHSVISLFARRISYSAAGPVDYTTLLVNADRCRYTFTAACIDGWSKSIL
jgi:hypothetical protein